MSNAGVVLSQPPIKTTPSTGWERRSYGLAHKVFATKAHFHSAASMAKCTHVIYAKPALAAQFFESFLSHHSYPKYDRSYCGGVLSQSAVLTIR